MSPTKSIRKNKSGFCFGRKAGWGKFFFNSLGEIKPGSFWSGNILPAVQSQFVNAKILPVSIKPEYYRRRSGNIFKCFLRSNLTGRSLVLALG